MLKPPASPAPQGARELGIAVRHVVTCPFFPPPAQSNRNPTVLVLLLLVAHSLDRKVLDHGPRVSS